MSWLRTAGRALVTLPAAGPSLTARTSATLPRRLFAWWLVLAVTCLALMWRFSGEETIPYHVAWAGFALAYGFVPWSRTRTVLGLGLFAVATGALLTMRAAAGAIPWDETAEIPLMTLLMVLMVWHARRRQSALTALATLVAEERARAEGRDRLTRLTSHEMRTPLTVARGYIELLLAKDPDVDRRADLLVVDDELDSLTRVCERLVRAMQLQDAPSFEPLDIDILLNQCVERWSPVVARTWVVESDAGIWAGSPQRFRMILDTLIENAVRYTSDGDVVRLFAHGEGGAEGQLCIGVADSGSGMSAELIEQINEGATQHLDLPRDELSQTGLGLQVVRTAVTARGGYLRADRAVEGGAMLVMHLPQLPPPTSLTITASAIAIASVIGAAPPAPSAVPSSLLSLEPMTGAAASSPASPRNTVLTP